MQKIFPLAVSLVISLAGLQKLPAQVRDAGSKMRDEAVSGHEVRTYQRHAQDHARMLYRRGRAQQPLPVEKAQSHATAIRQNVTEAAKSLDTLVKQVPNDRAIQTSAEAIRKQHDEVLAQCDELDAECKKADRSSETICECCALMEKSLAAAQKETEKLLKTLGEGDLGAPEETAREKQATTKSSAMPAKLTSANFLITGLHCPPCTSTVEGSLRTAKGVRSVKVDWKTKNAVVQFDESLIPAQKMASLIAATPHMMGAEMHYGGWLALKVVGTDKDETAAKAKEALGKVKGVANVAVYPKSESVGVAFTAEGNLTMHDLIAALEAAGLKASSYAENTVKTGFRSGVAYSHDDMDMNAEAGGHSGMAGGMSCPACQSMMGMKGMAGDHGDSPAVPSPKAIRPAGYAVSRSCGC